MFENQYLEDLSPDLKIFVKKLHINVPRKGLNPASFMIKKKKSINKSPVNIGPKKKSGENV